VPVWGGGANALAADGRVQVDGRPELRKTAKMRAGQVVRVGDLQIRVQAG
jgi:ribosome-associated protein